MTLPSVLRYATEQQVCWINFLCSLNIWTIHKVDPSHMLDFSTASDHQKIPHLLSYCTRLRCKFQRSMTLHYISTTVSDPSETFSSVDWPRVNAFVAGRSQNISGIVSLWNIFLTVKKKNQCISDRTRTNWTEWNPVRRRPQTWTFCFSGDILELFKEGKAAIAYFP